MAILITDATGKNTRSAYVRAPFDQAKARLEKAGYAVITPEQFAQLRIAKGAKHSVSTNGAYNSMGVVMIPQKGRYLTNLSLVMENPIGATQAHRNRKEFAVSNEDAERALARGSVVISYNQSAIPTNRFGEDAIGVFAFGKFAKAYGEFLAEIGITELPLWFNDEKYINSQKNAFANQAWLHRLGDDFRSGLGGGRILCYGSAGRGVRNVEPRSGETASKIYMPTFKQVAKYSKQFVPEVARKEFEKGLEALFVKR